MTDIHEMVSAVLETDAYKEFESGCECYLAHVFSNVKDSEQITEVGFYDSDEDKITVFTTDPVTRRPPEEAFKESGKIERLAIQDVTLGLGEARDLARQHREENYPGHPVSQEICILQQIDSKPVWNMTLVTQTLHMLNVRLDAVSGSVLETDMQNILALRK